MSDLRFFADQMYEMIDLERQVRNLERRLKQIAIQADDYTNKCMVIRQESLPRHNDRIGPSFYAANEGINAVKIVLAR